MRVPEGVFEVEENQLQGWADFGGEIQGGTKEEIGRLNGSAKFV